LRLRPAIRPGRVDGNGVSALEEACTRARGIEGGYRAVGRAHEAVIYIVRINVQSGDSPRGVESVDQGALVATRAGARNINRGDGAVRGAHKAVPHKVQVIGR
jgi:hypothetical protein